MSEHLRRAEALLRLAQLQSTREVLELLLAGKTDKEIARRTLLIAFMLDPKLTGTGTQRELARRMGVTEARVCQMLRGFKHFNAGFPNELSRLSRARLSRID